MRRVFFLSCCFFSLLALTGPAQAAEKPEAKVAAGATDFPCAEPGKVEMQIIPEAKLLEFNCHFGEFQKHDSLFFNVALQNVSDKPLRFRVNIFLDDGKAVGGLIPRTGKPPVLKPGEKATFEYPVQGMTEKPSGVTLIIKTASY
jgi:hypothetical protein